ncbi:hypothetical protein [Paenibacillus medicaginis]|uniref:Uncharacterized protein n=1 Tax=Paenibacillus medicaginis TaxID=1470560 RepID=A0ABV5C8T4_9BACL
MKNWIITLAVSACLFLLDMPLLIRSRKKRDWIVYSAMLTAGIVIVLLAAPQKRIPSPLYFLIWVYGPINHWLSSWFQ